MAASTAVARVGVRGAEQQLDVLGVHAKMILADEDVIDGLGVRLGEGPRQVIWASSVLLMPTMTT